MIYHYFFSIGLVLFLTSLGDFTGISSGSFAKLTGLSVSLLSLKNFLVFWIFGMNLDTTCYLNILFSLLVMRASYSDSYIAGMKFQTTSPTPLRSDILLALV